MPSLIVRRDPPLSGLRNMEIDESMLSEATPDSPIVLRLYQWDQPTLSLGHFQSRDDLLADPVSDRYPGLRQAPWVRRKTGGGAILHDQEWTYSVVIPAKPDEPSKGHSDRLYRAIHESIRDGLLAIGWAAELSENCTCGKDDRENQPFLCFERRSPVDIVVGSSKIVGSAQRRSRAGLLQHGSILIRGSSFAPHLPGLEELPPHPKPPLDWPDWLEVQIRNGLRHGLEADRDFSQLKNPPDRVQSVCRSVR
jgi:lipoate-protein ligase A